MTSVLNFLAEDGALHQGSGGVLGAPDLDGFVAYDLGVGVGGVDVVADGGFTHGGVVDGVYATFLPVGMNAVEKAVDGIEFLQSTQDINPAKWEKVSFGFLVSFREVGHTKSKGHQVVVLIDDKSGKIEVDEGEVFLHIDINLLVGERYEVVEVFEGVIEGVEELLGVGIDLLAVLEFEELEVVFLKDKTVDACHLWRNRLVSWHLVLRPLALGSHAVTLDELDVILRIVEGADVLASVETLDNPALFVHIGEAERSFYLVHAVLMSEIDHSVHQGGEYIIILDEIHPSEADSLLLPALVATVVDDGGDATHYLLASIGEVELHVAVFTRGVLVGQKFDLVADERRDVGGNVLEKTVRELYESVEFPAGGYWVDFNHLLKYLEFLEALVDFVHSEVDLRFGVGGHQGDADEGIL